MAKYGYQTHSLAYEKLFEQEVSAIKARIKPKVYRLIQNHYEKYFYISHMWVIDDMFVDTATKVRWRLLYY